MNRPDSPNSAPKDDVMSSSSSSSSDNSMLYLSPTCVIGQNSLLVGLGRRKAWNGVDLPEVPAIVWEDEEQDEESVKKGVQFSLPRQEDTRSRPQPQQPFLNEDVVVVVDEMDEVDEAQEESSNSNSNSNSSWYSRSEILAFHQTAKGQVQGFRRQNQGWIQEFCDDLCLEDDPGRRPPGLQRLLKLHRPPTDFDTVRGLHLDARLIQHRRLHSQRVLLIQGKCPKSSSSSSSSSSSRESILRLTSLQTSRSSRTLARWLAHYDCMDMVYMIRHELLLEQQQQQQQHQQQPQEGL
jgi:hypothetical protein